MWIEHNQTLKRTFIFSDFVEAFGFLTQVAIIAEKQNHHPHIVNVYNRVELSLTTHDAGNTITNKDYLLAKSIDALVR